MARERLRFSFTVEDGPNAGLTTGGWRVWVNKEDTYITSKSSPWKVSLHADEAWRYAVDASELRKPEPVWTEPDRAPWKFTPTPWINGARLVFAIAICRHALLPRPLLPEDVHIRVEDRWDQLTLAYVNMSEPGVGFRAERVVGGPLQLASGRQVWVSAGTEPLLGGEAEPLAIGSMIEPMQPEHYGVNAPGVMLKGVRRSAEAA